MTDSAFIFPLVARGIGGRPAVTDAGQFCALGIATLDAVLGGGLARGSLHELFAGAEGDVGSVAGFAAMLSRRLGTGLFWLRSGDVQKRSGLLHAPGLAELGCDPARLVLAVLPDVKALLRATADIVRSAQAGTVVAEIWGNPPLLDLTASRRLVLAAEISGTTVLMLRVAATPAPSAARTRWSVAAAPSVPLAADAPGRVALDIELLRQRGGPAGGRWRVEWDRDLGTFEEPEAVSGAVLPVFAGGSAGPGIGQQRRRA